MNEIKKRDKLRYYKFLNLLPKKLNRLYFSKLKGKFKLKNKSKIKKLSINNKNNSTKL